MNEIKNFATQYDDGMITAREFVGKLIDVLVDEYQGPTDDNEMESLAKLAQDLAIKLG